LFRRATSSPAAQRRELDPGACSDWIRLDRLYQDAGRLGGARLAAEAAAKVAEHDCSKSLTLPDLGEVLVAQGDPVASAKAHAEAPTILCRFGATNSTNTIAQRDVSVALFIPAQEYNAAARWSDVVAQMGAMDARGPLARADRPFLDQARANAAEEAGK